MSAQDSATRPCPYCKEEVKAAAVRCKHCQATIPAGRRFFRLAEDDTGEPGEQTPPGTQPPARAATCPPAILDTDPEGHGLGVWVLVKADDEYCTYEYAGGIS